MSSNEVVAGGAAVARMPVLGALSSDLAFVLLMARNAARLEASVPSYVGGITRWAAAVIMVSTPRALAC